MSGTGYTRQSAGSIVSGLVITAAAHNNEFNQLQSAFNSSTGHAHDGGTGGGAKVASLNGLASTGGYIKFDGANTFSPILATELDGIVALATTGYVKRTGAGAYSTTNPVVLLQRSYTTGASSTFIDTSSHQVVSVSFTPQSASSKILIKLDYTVVAPWINTSVVGGQVGCQVGNELKRDSSSLQTLSLGPNSAVNFGTGADWFGFAHGAIVIQENSPGTSAVNYIYNIAGNNIGVGATQTLTVSKYVMMIEEWL